MRHEIKEWRAGFASLLDGRRYEIRRDDRKYSVGDELWIREWDHRTGELTGQSGLFRILHVTRRDDGRVPLEGLLSEGAVVLGLEAIGSLPILGELAPELRVLVDAEIRLSVAVLSLSRAVDALDHIDTYDEVRRLIEEGTGALFTVLSTLERARDSVRTAAAELAKIEEANRAATKGGQV